MTEGAWLTGGDPRGMWEFVSDTASDRKWRLLAVAFCRRIWALLPDPRSRAAVEVAERYADGEASEGERAEACIAAGAADVIGVDDSPAQAGAHAASGSNHLFTSFHAALDAVGASGDGNAVSALAEVVRDVFGNPFRPVAFAPEWRTDTAVTLARQMYDARDFSAMPILADALQDAGCDEAAVLDHCRGEGPHVRGCWVVDSVLGQE